MADDLAQRARELDAQRIKHRIAGTLLDLTLMIDHLREAVAQDDADHRYGRGSRVKHLAVLAAEVISDITRLDTLVEWDRVESGG